MIDPKLSNLSTSVFWYKPDDTIEPLHGVVGVKKIEDKEDGEAHVTFSVHPTGVEFIGSMSEGEVEIRFNAIPLGSPVAGKSFCTIRDIRPQVVSVENIASLEMQEREMFFIVEAKCFITWNVFEAINPELSHEWRVE